MLAAVAAVAAASAAVGLTSREGSGCMAFEVETLSRCAMGACVIDGACVMGGACVAGIIIIPGEQLVTPRGKQLADAVVVAVAVAVVVAAVVVAVVVEAEAQSAPVWAAFRQISRR